MKRFFTILFFLCFTCVTVYSNDVESKDLSTFQSKSQNKFRIFSFLEDIVSLSNKFSKKNVKLSERLLQEVENIILDLVSLLNMENICSKSFCSDLTYFSQIENLKDHDAQLKLIKSFLTSKDSKVVTAFLKQVFKVLSGYLKDKANDIILEIKNSLKGYFLRGEFVYSSDDKIESRLGKKESQIIASLFGTAANILFNSIKPSSENNNTGSTNDNTLAAVAATCNMVSNIAAINAENKKGVDISLEESDNNIDSLVKNWICQKFLASPFFKKMVKEVIGILKGYLKSQIVDLLDHLCDKLINVLTDSNVLNIYDGEFETSSNYRFGSISS